MSDGEGDDGLEYLERLDRFIEGTEQTTLYFELEKRNLAPDLRDDLTDSEVSQALTNLIWSLKDIRVFVEFTDHMSDRELYAALLEFCDEPNVCFADCPNGALHWSAIGGASEDDESIWLRYYADPEDRASHMLEYPNDPIPPCEPPPHPRPWIPERDFPSFEEAGDEG
jgi:hypothetical protein